MTRRLRPVVESMESRQLLSVTAVLALHRQPVYVAMGGGAGGGSAGGGGGTGGPTSGVNGGNGLVLTQGTPNQYIQPTGTPTAREQRRQKFFFSFSGAYIQTPGRFSDEATFVRIVGVGTSTYFLHGEIQLNAIVPTDPARPTAGTFTAFDRNINSNSAFAFNLNGTTASLDRGNRPTQFDAVTETNASSGIFAEAQSAATVQIRYFPDGKHHPRGVTSGRATVLVRGSAYTLGTNNILAGPIPTTNSLNSNKVRV